jgi:hypothetical protein
MARARSRREVRALSTDCEAERRRIRRRIEALVAEVEAEGWTVRFVKYCEDTQTPGFLGQLGGVTLATERLIKIRTYKMTLRQRLAILEHEIEHMHGAEWATDHEVLGLRCGGRVNFFGEPTSTSTR